MHFPLQPFRQLEQLSQGLGDPGDDLQSILAVLVEDLTAAVPSFTGMLITIPVEDQAVSIAAVDSAAAAASMLLPLHMISDLPDDSVLVLYAGEPDAFLALAADARATYGLDGQVELDRHLPPPDVVGSAEIVVHGASQHSTINQALGVLIARGHPPELARDELDVRAAAANASALQYAQQILDALTGESRRPGPPPAPLDPDGESR